VTPGAPLALRIVEVDPQGPDALALLYEAALEARALYPELTAADAPWPTNPPTPPGGIYLIAYDGGRPLACAALRPLDGAVVEVRRMFVTTAARRRGVARQVLAALEAAARRLGYTTMRLQTGNRQLPAMRLYLDAGFTRVPPFVHHVDDPTSVCFEKRVSDPAR
jgi:GNAT superfamily N-acetyltransferase